MNAIKKLIALLLIAMISTTAFAITDAQVFAYAEANYPDIFTGTATAGQYQQYNYRYYPASGNYLAVDTNNEIFILGPYTGNVITAVGSVTDFSGVITAWEATQEASTLRNCIGNPALYTTGNTYQVDEQLTDSNGRLGEIISLKTTVNGPATFQGYSAIELQTDFTSPSTGFTTGKAYGQLTATDWIDYGRASYNYMEYYSPPAQGSLDLAIKTPETRSTQKYIQATTTIPPQTVNTTDTFLGIETVTIPAGTFSACKIKVDFVNVGIGSGTQYHWYIASGRYSGLRIKTEFDNGYVMRATNVLFNGL